MPYLLRILLTIAMCIALVEDLRHQRIPNLVNFPTMAMALIYHSYAGGLAGFLFSGGGLLLGIGIFIIPYMMGGMGAGDVKLMGAAGAIFGAKGIIIASILVVLIGGIYGLILMVMNPDYLSNFFKRHWLTLKTFVLTRQVGLIPPPDLENRLVLKFAVPIALGTMGYMAMLITGYDLFPRLLGDQFQLFSIAMH